MAYTIIQQAPVAQQVAGQTAWAVTLTVRSTDELLYPTKVLVFQAENPLDPHTRGWFTAVASPAQLEEYPPDAPADSSGDQQPYYRLDSVTLVSRSADAIEQLVAQFYEEVDLLFRNLDALRRLADPLILLPPVRASVDIWPGSSLLGPFTVLGAAPGRPAVSAHVEFQMDGETVVFSTYGSDDGVVDIVDPDAWTFRIPAQQVFLIVGQWSWTLTAVDDQGTAYTCFSGLIVGQY